MPKQEAAARVRNLLDQVKLPRDALSRLPREFSGGQRQRIAIARALALSPRLVVCDEPVSALDLSTQARVLDLFKEIQEATGVAYLFISHDLTVVRHLSHRVAVMYHGEIVEYGDGKPGDGRARPPLHPAAAAGLTGPGSGPPGKAPHGTAGAAGRRAGGRVMTAVTEDPAIAEAIAALTLEEKVQLLTGRDFWSTWPNENIGLRRIVFSDGPSGVRGEAWDERDPSLNLPSATALASSWDPDIARRYGAAAAVEARRKGVDVVLGPTINLHRSPLGGRHFEAFSEDPVLTADIAAAYVRGVQDNGVGATLKHYVANDSETDRFTVDVRVSERALRELYLLAFEKAVTQARAWLVMSSYNSVNGTTATENGLLETPLNSEWGFDGVVVSDWTAVRSLASATASQDLVMPGPGGPWGDALVLAIRSGEISEAVVDRKVARILTLARRVGALGGVGRCRAGLGRGRRRLRPAGGHRGHRAAGKPRRAAVGSLPGCARSP